MNLELVWNNTLFSNTFNYETSDAKMYTFDYKFDDYLIDFEGDFNKINYFNKIRFIIKLTLLK